jgi:hypothetical protein
MGTRKRIARLKAPAYAIFVRKKIRKNRGNEGNNDTLADCGFALTVDKYKPLGPLGSCVVYGAVLCMWCGDVVPPNGSGAPCPSCTIQ